MISIQQGCYRIASICFSRWDGRATPSSTRCWPSSCSSRRWAQRSCIAVSTSTHVWACRWMRHTNGSGVTTATSARIDSCGWPIGSTRTSGSSVRMSVTKSSWMDRERRRMIANLSVLHLRSRCRVKHVPHAALTLQDCRHGGVVSVRPGSASSLSAGTNIPSIRFPCDSPRVLKNALIDCF